MSNQMKIPTSHRVLEQNRRNHMNMLYSSLKSLLPAHKREVKLALPDMVQEASNYIQDLQKEIAEIGIKRDNIKPSKQCFKISPQHKDKDMIDNLEPGKATDSTPTVCVNCFGSNVTVDARYCASRNEILLSDIMELMEGEGLEILSACTVSRSDIIFHSFCLKALDDKAINGDILYEKLLYLVAKTYPPLRPS